MIQLPDKLNTGENRLVLDHLSGRSAHSDVAEALELAIAPLGAAHTYCPDSDKYKYILAFAKETVFSYAVDMKTIAFRLSPDYKHKAIKSGGEAVVSIGNDWVTFDLFRSDWPEVDVKFWARKAYLFALRVDDT